MPNVDVSEYCVHDVVDGTSELDVSGQGAVNSAIGKRTWVTGAWVSYTDDDGRLQRIPVHFGVEEQQSRSDADADPNTAAGQFLVFFSLGHRSNSDGTYLSVGRGGDVIIIDNGEFPTPNDAALTLQEWLTSNIGNVHWKNTTPPWTTHPVFGHPRGKKFGI